MPSVWQNSFPCDSFKCPKTRNIVHIPKLLWLGGSHWINIKFFFLKRYPYSNNFTIFFNSLPSQSKYKYEHKIQFKYLFSTLILNNIGNFYLNLNLFHPLYMSYLFSREDPSHPPVKWLFLLTGQLNCKMKNNKIIIINKKKNYFIFLTVNMVLSVFHSVGRGRPWIATSYSASIVKSLYLTSTVPKFTPTLHTSIAFWLLDRINPEHLASSFSGKVQIFFSLQEIMTRRTLNHGDQLNEFGRAFIAAKSSSTLLTE